MREGFGVSGDGRLLALRVELRSVLSLFSIEKRIRVMLIVFNALRKFDLFFFPLLPPLSSDSNSTQCFENRCKLWQVTITNNLKNHYTVHNVAFHRYYHMSLAHNIKFFNHTKNLKVYIILK